MKRSGLILIGIIVCLPLLIYGTIRTANGIMFDRSCGGHIKRAADANSVELAKQELNTAIKYLDDNNMKSGYTSVLWTTPDADVGFWYTNLKTCQKQLNELPPTTTQAEKDMVLLKLRQTLLDHGKEGEKVTAPPNVAVFPNNVMFCLFGWASTILAGVGIFLILCAIIDD